MRPLHRYSAGLALALLVLIAGCQSTSAPYSAAADREIGLLKSRSLRLMERAEHPFQTAARDVDRLRADLREAQGAAAARPRNETTVEQWRLLLAPDGNLLGGFLARWERENTLSPTFIVEAGRLVEEAFEALREGERVKLGGPAR